MCQTFLGSGRFSATAGGWISGSIHSGRIIGIGYGEEPIPAENAGLYRLPAWLRQPLIQGMQERGPEAYQALVEAYYRQLSEELEK